MTAILIIGSDSTIGAHLKKQFEMQGETVYGTTRHKDRLSNTTFFLDLLNPDAFNLPNHINIDSAVFCAAMSTIKECEENKVLSHQINVDSPIKIARYLKNNFNPFMIFLSSNAVFDGSRPFFSETAPPCPINYYGYCKAEAEKKFAEVTTRLSILRLTKVLYPEHPLIKKWRDALKNNQPIYPFSNVKLAPISLNDVSETIEKIAALQQPGIFHLSGDKDISYADLARKLANELNITSQLVISSHSTNTPISLYDSLDMKESKKIHAQNNSAIPDKIKLI